MRQVFMCMSSTGAELREGHRVIEVGAVEILNKQITERQLHCYVNPRRPVDEKSFEEHGISDEFLEDKPEFSQVLRELDVFLDNSELLVTNIDDLLFIQAEFGLHRLYPRNKKLTETANFRAVQDCLTGSQKIRFESSAKFPHSASLDFPSALARAENLAKAYLEATDNEIVVSSVNEFLSMVGKGNPNDLFRGVPDRSFRLFPSLFRHSLSGHRSREGRMMWVFKAHSRPHFNHQPENQIQWLTLAQHHGLPTRLLDWTFSPLVACFFAVREMAERDGAVYVYEAREYFKEERINLEKLTKPVAFLPSHGSKRITAQSGAFTIHPDNCPELDEQKILKIIIPKNLKEAFSKTLSTYGINSSTIFPDLDGLCAHIKRQQGY